MYKKLFRCLFSLVASLLLFLSTHAQAQKPWTFLVYMAAANDLNPYALLDLQEMMKVGSNENVNILVYLTLQEDGKPKVTQKLYIAQDRIVQIGDSMMRDSGDLATLEEALQWACFDYPADHMAVVLWNHGSGPLNRSMMGMLPKGVCYDFDTDHYLTDRDCLEAFTWAKNVLRGGKKIDIIAIDACLLASLEIAYTLSSCADYFVASEETIPGDGYQYAYLLKAIADNDLDPLSFAQFMVKAYKQEYYGTLDYTLSATDLKSLYPLVENCNAVAHVLESQLRGKYKNQVKTTIKKCINKLTCPSFDDGLYIDVLAFYKNLLKNVKKLKLSKSLVKQFGQVLKNGIKLFGTIIKANVTSINHRNAGGLSIYFARHSIDPSYYGLYWTEKNPNWLSFLEAFLA